MMLNTYQFLALNEKNQVKLLTNNVSTFDEFIVYLETIQIQHDSLLLIDFEHVIRKSVQILLSRVTLAEEIEIEYSDRYLDEEEQCDKLNKLKRIREEKVKEIWDICLRKDVTQSTTSRRASYVCPIEKYFEMKEMNSNDMKEAMKMESKFHEKKKRRNSMMVGGRKLSIDYEKRLSLGYAVTLDTRASFVSVAV